MLETVTDVPNLVHYGNTSVFPTAENSSQFIPDREINITKPHKCLQILYEDIGQSRYGHLTLINVYRTRICPLIWCFYMSVHIHASVLYLQKR